MRVAVVGKGGAGKTTVAGTLARLLARRGGLVVAADLDPNPGLTWSLGLPVVDAGLPDAALREDEEAPYGWRLATGLTPTEAVERFAVIGPDGVRYLSPGKIDGATHGVSRSLTAVREILAGLHPLDCDVIADLEAGPTTPFEGYHSFADRVLVIVTPGWSSALTARRLRPIVEDVPITIVANRWGDQAQHRGLRAETIIPADPCIAEADRLGRAPLDHCPGSPAVQAIEALAERLRRAEGVAA